MDKLIGKVWIWSTASKEKWHETDSLLDGLCLGTKRRMKNDIICRYIQNKYDNFQVCFQDEDAQCFLNYFGKLTRADGAEEDCRRKEESNIWTKCPWNVESFFEYSYTCKKTSWWHQNGSFYVNSEHRKSSNNIASDMFIYGSKAETVGSSKIISLPGSVSFDVFFSSPVIISPTVLIFPWALINA